jgi:hypothetical protein
MIIKNHRIEIVDTDYRSDNVLIFDFNNKSILSKLVYKILLLFGNPITSREFLVKEKLKDDDIVRYIYEQQSLLEHFAKKTPKYLIIGHDVMQELKLRTTYGSFVLGDSFSESFIKKRFAGLEVILLPTMSGAVVLHDLCENIPAESFNRQSIAGIDSIKKI